MLFYVGPGEYHTGMGNLCVGQLNLAIPTWVAATCINDSHR